MENNNSGNGPQDTFDALSEYSLLKKSNLTSEQETESILKLPYIVQGPVNFAFTQ